MYLSERNEINWMFYDNYFQEKKLYRIWRNVRIIFSYNETQKMWSETSVDLINACVGIAYRNSLL